MQLVETIEHVFLPWLVWVSTVVAWVFACLRLEDFRGIHGNLGQRWRLAVLAVGPMLFFGTIQAGLRIIFLAAFAITGLLGFALWKGDYLSAWLASGESSIRAGGAFGWNHPWASLIATVRSLGKESPTASTSREPNVLLYKKDGSSYGGNELGRHPPYALTTARRMLGRATSIGATDVHLEPKPGGEIQVRYRIDGILQPIKVLPHDGGQGVVTLLKVLADMDIAERRRPQDGTFALTADGSRFDVRAATASTQFGEKIVLRLLDSTGGVLREGLNSLGMPPDLVDGIRRVIHRSQGLLIVCGPTGSGKTTSVYGALGEIDALSRNVITIEDPIEYQLPNISQIAVSNSTDVTFAKVLRSVLRQDPDVLLVGEIRDKETAEIAMQAALTGHLVLTTIHSNDAPTTITRLIDIGVDASLIQSTVTGILAQRLVRVLCPACKRAAPGSPAAEGSSSADEPNIIYRATGCGACLKTGYKGRTGVYEYLEVNGAIRNLLTGRPSIETLRAVAKQHGMTTLKRAAKQKVLEGITSVDEARRVVT